MVSLSLNLGLYPNVNNFRLGALFIVKDYWKFQKRFSETGEYTIRLQTTEAVMEKSI